MKNKHFSDGLRSFVPIALGLIVLGLLTATATRKTRAAVAPEASGGDQITIAQISDTHISDKHAPHAADNLKRAVEIINARRPDAVIPSGDIGENPHAWDEAKSILKKLKAPLYYVPGNHDVHSSDLER